MHGGNGIVGGSARGGEVAARLGCNVGYIGGRAWHVGNLQFIRGVVPLDGGVRE